jgi:hypothetical protein
MGGVALPEKSAEGYRLFVVAIGPKVEGLQIGDEVQPGGSDLTFDPILECPDLVMLQEKYLVGVFES